uniref:DNA-directed RNA polymerase n=1 Tax=Panagrellus redivivus TaxID=6233 RepID=A0A7E4UYQ3_PANRE
MGKLLVPKILVYHKHLASTLSSAARPSSSSNDWEKHTVKALNKLFTETERATRNNLTKKNVQSCIVNFIRSDDTRQLFGMSTDFAKKVKRNPKFAISPEFFPVVLKYTALLFESGSNALTKEKWKSSINGALNFLSTLDLRDDLTVVGYGAAVASLRTFVTKNAEKLDLADVEEPLQQCEFRLQKAVVRSHAKPNMLLFDHEDYDRVELLKTGGLADMHRESHYANSLGYDNSSTLVKDLSLKKPFPEYTSPFSITQRSASDYESMFRDQIKSELGGFLKVKNFARKSKLKPMEAVIDEWKWEANIAAQLKAQANYIRDPQIKSCFIGINFDECAKLITDVVKCELSQGQNYFTVGSFQYSLANAVLQYCYRSFLDKINISADEVTTSTFSKFVTYFDDPTLPQRYTLREWWMICCHNLDVDPELTLPLVDFKRALLQKISMVVSNIVMNTCRFPFKSAFKPALFYDKVSHEEESKVTTETKISLSKMVRIHPAVMSLMAAHEFEFMLFPHEFLPMRVPPRPWIDTGKNGPFYSRPSQLIRIANEYRHVDVNKEFELRQESPAQVRPVLDALNDLGSTPWIINNEMLDVLVDVFTLGSDETQAELLSKLSVPMHASAITVPELGDMFPEGSVMADVTTAQWRKYYTDKADALKKKNEMNSLWCWLHYRISLARHYRNDVLFFPHNMDFRGRVYPISPHLNHMGDDINRCLLKFAKGKPLGERGLYWLKLHIVNITGLLKRKSIADRVVYADERLDDMLDSANNPLTGRRWWLESDDPWQTLAACKELRDALKLSNPAEFISHLPIHQDGSCNGLQHYAALGRDKEGALEVNLLPCDVPADVYSSVAARVESKRIEDEQNPDAPGHEVAVELRAAMPQTVPRKVVKQTVMTTVYGVTPFGARQQIKRQLKALGIPSEEAARYAKYLAERTLASLHDAFTASMNIKEWLRDCASATTQLMKPIEWTTPLGMPVMQPYLSIESKQNKICLLPVRHKQVNAFPPNYVHSLDSTHMMLTALHCHKRGITFAAVHDCFWTHACTVDEMNVICREQFVRMHSEPLIERLAEDLKRRYLPENFVKLMSKEQAQHFESTLTPDFTPGELEISKVHDSVYFFS